MVLHMPELPGVLLWFYSVTDTDKLAGYEYLSSLIFSDQFGLK